MIVVVSDTSPVRALVHLGCLDVLRTLFAEVLLPPAVERELINPPKTLTMVDVSRYSFIRVANPTDAAKVQQFLQRLDPGESEALVLALEVNADAILMDEAAGRKEAALLGLTVIGTLGILLTAKMKGLIRELRPLVIRLESELGFFISQELHADVLARAGE